MTRRRALAAALGLALGLTLGGCTPGGGEAVSVPTPSPALAATPTPGAAPGPVPSSRPPQASAPPSTPGPTVTVRTHWAALGPKPTPAPAVELRWYEEDPDRLIPRPDYGTLIPYAGQRLDDGEFSETGCVYGLMTAQGAVVTAPVYASAYRCAGTSLLILGQGDADSKTGECYAVAAPDGSWVTGFDYLAVRPADEGVVLSDGAGLTLMDREGTVRYQLSWQEMGVPEPDWRFVWEDLIFAYMTGLWEWRGDYLCADASHIYRLSTGETIPASDNTRMDYFAPRTEEPWRAEPGAPGETVLRRGEERRSIPYAPAEDRAYVEGELVLFPRSGAVYTLDGAPVLPGGQGREVTRVHDQMLGDGAPGALAVWEPDGGVEVFREDGSPLLHLRRGTEERSCFYLGVKNGLLEVLETRSAAYYALSDGRCVLRTCLDYQPD